MTKDEVIIIIVALLVIGFNEYNDYRLNIQEQKQPQHYEVIHENR